MSRFNSTLIAVIVLLVLLGLGWYILSDDDHSDVVNKTAVQPPFEFDNPATPAVTTKFMTPDVQELHKSLSLGEAKAPRVVPLSVCASYQEALDEMDNSLKKAPEDQKLLSDKERIASLMGKMACPGHVVTK